MRTLKAAKHFREKFGEFYPIGATVDANGKITPAETYDGDEHPQSQHVIDELVAGFASQARKNVIRACAIGYDIFTTDPTSGVKSDAIAVACNGAGLEGVTIVTKYRAKGKKIVFFDRPFLSKNPYVIFPGDDER